MLENLKVKNYVLIDNLDLDFSNGFTCITGETGSGKTIILGALSLLLGEKADKECVRSGADSAEISGVFSTKSTAIQSWLDRHNIETEDEQILIRRVIKVNGRSAYTINGSQITRSEGEELGQLLVDVSSQHSHQSLMKNETLREMLDEASGSKNILEQYSKVYQEYKDKEKELEDLSNFISKNNEEAEYLRFCLNELDNADLKVGEEEELRESLAIISSAEFLAETLTSAQTELKNAIALLSESLQDIHKAAKKDSRLLDLSSRLESQSIESDDIYQSIRDYISSISFSEYELQEKNERLAIIQKIKRRFGGSVEEAIKRREEYRAKLLKAEDGEENIKLLEKEVEVLKEKAIEQSSELTKIRKTGAVNLAKSIECNLHKLGMKSAIMDIEVSALDTLNTYGKDKICFKIAANKGEKFSEIQNTSSGGELSRLMLALKVSLKSAGGIETLLFDEIDSGIGGVIANNVSDELKGLSKTHQVLAITHLSQLAVKADNHFLVYKTEMGGRTISNIRKIEGDERVNEIARLLSGETSDISLEHARTLLEVQD